MTILSDEIVEKALDPAIAEFERLASNKHLGTADCVHGAVRAALLAALPDIVERCCQAVREEAEAHLGDIQEGDEEGAKMVRHAVGCLLTVEEDIRSLSTNTKGDSNG